MRVDALAVHLRPRPMSEACDLGVLLVHHNAKSVWSCYAPVMLCVLVVALATMEIAPWLPTVLIFWLKPWLDRTLLFVLSRAVFGEATRPRDLWAHRGPVWFGQLLSTLTLRRLSLWRTFTQPVYQLEGQRGSARRKRRNQLLKGKRGAAMMLEFAFSNIELVLSTGLIAVLIWFAPDSARMDVMKWLGSSESGVHHYVLLFAYAATVLFLEPFFVGAGFAMYLNRRVELEAWDIEQEFRRVFAR
ncbi:MAG: hypothetical protein H7255_07125 [Ramlibacter sp.]|nr:hypothetical protein [Ramlibacter sp.]